jgi:hypothetical protein
MTVEMTLLTSLESTVDSKDYTDLLPTVTRMVESMWYLSVADVVAIHDDIAPFEDWSFFVSHCSFSTLGCGSCGACSRHASLSSVPSWSLNSSVAHS